MNADGAATRMELLTQRALGRDRAHSCRSEHARDEAAHALGVRSVFGEQRAQVALFDQGLGEQHQGEREQKRDAMQQDPQWQVYLKMNAEAGYMEHMENRILRSTSFSPL